MRKIVTISVHLAVFKSRRKVRVRIKSRHRTPAKFALVLSGIHKVVDVQGVVVSVCKIGTSSVYLVDLDRLTNFMLYSSLRMPKQVQESSEKSASNYANSSEKFQEDEDNLAPTCPSQEMIMCTRSGPLVQLTRHSDFDYYFTLCKVCSNSFQVPLSLYLIDSDAVSFNSSFCTTDI